MIDQRSAKTQWSRPYILDSIAVECRIALRLTRTNLDYVFCYWFYLIQSSVDTDTYYHCIVYHIIIIPLTFIFAGKMKNPLWFIIWLILLIISFFIAGFCAGWYIFVHPLTVCIPAVSVSTAYNSQNFKSQTKIWIKCQH